jgi:hypothetical protein
MWLSILGPRTLENTLEIIFSYRSSVGTIYTVGKRNPGGNEETAVGSNPRMQAMLHYRKALPFRSEPVHNTVRPSGPQNLIDSRG